jgi:hypothetical protein
LTTPCCSTTNQRAALPGAIIIATGLLSVTFANTSESITEPEGGGGGGGGGGGSGGAATLLLPPPQAASISNMVNADATRKFASHKCMSCPCSHHIRAKTIASAGDCHSVMDMRQAGAHKCSPAGRTI